MDKFLDYVFIFQVFINFVKQQVEIVENNDPVKKIRGQRSSDRQRVTIEDNDDDDEMLLALDPSDEGLGSDDDICFSFNESGVGNILLNLVWGPSWS